MQTKVTRFLVTKARLLLGLGVFFLVIFFFTKIVLWGNTFMKSTGLTPITVFRLVFDNGTTLKETNGRTNVLILGISGGSHAGADLTDTMLVASIDAKRNRLALISIPRDLWSDTLKDKINSAYHYGEEKKSGGGMVLAKAITEDVVGLPVHYGFLVDFSGFTTIIDQIGGIEVTVPNSFTDLEFPIVGKEDDACDGDPLFLCRYQPLTFEVGKQHMDGQRALQYVRSRHAQGDEGSDFARGRRQQDMLVAIKDKVLNSRLYLSPSRIISLIHAIDKATYTDFRIGDQATLAKIISRIPEAQMTRISIEDELTQAPQWLYGRYALVPIESWDALHAYIRSQLD